MASATSARWYTRSKAIARLTATELQALADALGSRLDRRRLCYFRRIAKLHPRIGLLCDDLAAPLDVVRRIAHAGGPAAQRARATTELAALVERRARKGAPAIERALLAVLDEL